MERQDIARAALRLLNADPTASMSQIAAAAQISRATLHRHYTGREDLVAQLGWMSLESWRAALDAAGVDVAEASGDAETIRRAVSDLCRELVRDADEYGFALTEPSLSNDSEITAVAEELNARERAFCKAAQRAGVMRDDLPAAWIGNALFGLLVGLREALRRGEIAVADAERLLRETLLRGVSA